VLHHVAGLAVRYVLQGRFAIIFKGQGVSEGDIDLLSSCFLYRALRYNHAMLTNKLHFSN
jgi:hypothetical protein